IEKVGESMIAVAEALPEMIGHTIELGNQLFEMSMKTGASVENLSALRFVASQTGMDFESLTRTFFMMEKNLGETGKTGEKVRGALDQLGLSMRTLKNESPDQAFIQIVSALEQVGNQSDKTHIAMQIFGRGAKDMMGLMSEDITSLIQEAKDLGLVW